MGRYIEWDDVVKRYPTVSKLGGAEVVGLDHVPYAEAEVDARLSPAFTVPFSSNNQTARDLSIDLTYLRANPLRDPEKNAPVQERVDNLIAALLEGRMAMVTTSGDVIQPALVGGVSPWSNTMNYHPTFGAGPIEDMHVDSGQLYDEAVTRGDLS